MENKQSFKFDEEVFFKTLAKKNITQYLLDRPHMLKSYATDRLFEYALAKGFGFKDKKNKNYSDILDNSWAEEGYGLFDEPSVSFKNLSSNLKYVPIIQLHDIHPEDWECKTEIGYLYSKKSNSSFLISSSSHLSDRVSDRDGPSILKKFENFNIKNISELPGYYLKNLRFKSRKAYELFNIVHLNANIKWDIRYLKKVFSAAAISKRKIKRKWKSDKKHPDKTPDWYFNVWFFKKTEKQMVNIKGRIKFNEAFMKI